MGWYSIDAVESAINRTKKALIEPFNFWKWIKLGIIVILIGGGGGGGSFYNTSGVQQPPAGEEIDVQIDEIISQISQFWDQYSTLILIVAAFILFIILLFSYISNVMEFVFVESLVTNVVTFWAYSGKYLRLGFNLFIIRLILGLSFLTLFILALLQIIAPIIESGKISTGVVFGAILWFVVVLLAIAVANGIIQSFINLSIPVAMYNNLGIIAAIKKILGNFTTDWKQIIMYWFVRFILGIAVGIIMFIVVLILFLILAIILAIPGAILYFVLSGIGTGNALFWIIMVPFFLIALVIFVFFILFVAPPAPVFMKYHMLTFLQSWYKDAGIPFFDVQVEGTGEVES